MNFKIEQIHSWLKMLLGEEPYTFDMVTADASFRQYYRIKQGDQTWVLMDAPPEKEKPDIFFRVARLMQSYGMKVPDCIAYHQELGLILLTDFGDQQLFHVKNTVCQDVLYNTAIDMIFSFRKIDSSLVPAYEYRKFCSEVDLLTEWFYPFIGYQPSCGVKQGFERLRHELAQSCLVQPQVFIHRDFHSRNLMVLSSDSLGMLDFQDAVCGPITYDLVSLLRDCYISFEDEYVYEKVRMVYDVFQEQLEGVDFLTFKRWFDWAGLQRHLKCLGIFSRLKLRDDRDDFLPHIPRVVGYVSQVLNKYEALSYFNEIWQREVLPVMSLSEEK